MIGYLGICFFLNSDNVICCVFTIQEYFKKEISCLFYR